MRSKTIGSSTAGNNTGSATADYTSIAAWKATIADTDDETGTVITKVAATDTSAFTIAPSNTGSYAYLLTADSTCAAADLTYSDCSTKARVACGGAASPITINVKNFTWEKVGVLLGSNNNMTAFTVGDYDNVRLRRLMVAYTVAGSANCGFLAYSGTSGNSCIVTNVGFSSLTSGSDIFGSCRTSGGLLKIYNCSMVASSWYSTFFFDGGGNVTPYACVIQGTGGVTSSTSYGDEIICQSSSTPPGSNSYNNRPGLFKNTTIGSEDLNLYGLNGGLIIGVTDRSGTEGDLSTDIKGNARPLAAGFPIDPGAAMISAGPSVLAYADSGNEQTGTPMTLSLTVSGSNRKLLVLYHGNAAPTAVDWNSTTMTAVTSAQFTSSGYYTDAYELDNPTTGAHTLTFAATGLSRGWIAAYVIGFANDSNNPVTDVADGATAGSATSISKSTTTAVANEGAFQMLGNSSSSLGPYPSTPGALRRKSSTASFGEGATATQLAVSAGSNTAAWTFNTGAVEQLTVVYIKAGASVVTFIAHKPVMLNQAVNRAGTY